MKNKLRFSFLIIGVLLYTGIKLTAQDKLADILSDEINREMSYLKAQETPAYYISYRLEHSSSSSFSTSMGALTNTNQGKIRLLTVCVRVGSPQLDNYHPVRDNAGNSGNSLIDLPLDDNPSAIKQCLWNATIDAYQQAVTDYTRVRTNIAVKVKEDDQSPDFTLGTPTQYFEPEIDTTKLKFDQKVWIQRMKAYSSQFLSDSSIYSGLSYFSFTCSRKYFVSSQGDRIIQNRTSAELGITGTIKATDGMDIPLIKTYSADYPENLPADDSISKDVQLLVKNLGILKNAPMADPYTGPALLSGRAAAVFFHEIFGHRIESQRMKNENDAQTFKKKVGEQVLSTHLNVYCDPLTKSLNGETLNGYYLYDDQGTKAQKVNIVENGILKDFLTSRTPIEGFLKSNGHGRSMVGLQPVSRQSNLIVESTQPKTMGQLRTELIKLAKAQNKPYGYLFDDVIGGFTNTGRYQPNAFNVFPTLVYRIYTDGRADELVRGVDLVGTPLSMFSQIDMAGGNTGIFNGVCGAESGSIPVSAVCLMLLVKNIETQKNAKSQDHFILSRPDVKK